MSYKKSSEENSSEIILFQKDLEKGREEQETLISQQREQEIADFKMALPGKKERAKDFLASSLKAKKFAVLRPEDIGIDVFGTLIPDALIEQCMVNFYDQIAAETGLINVKYKFVDIPEDYLTSRQRSQYNFGSENGIFGTMKDYQEAHKTGIKRTWIVFTTWIILTCLSMFLFENIFSKYPFSWLMLIIVILLVMFAFCLSIFAVFSIESIIKWIVERRQNGKFEK